VPEILDFFFLGLDEKKLCIVVMDIRTCGERRMKLSESRTLFQLVKMLKGLLWFGVV